MKGLFFGFLIATGALFAGPQALSELVYTIRDPKTDAKLFRESLKKIGEQLAWDVVERFETEETTVETLTGKIATHELVKETPVLVTILRAGLPLNDGVLEVFPNAEVGFFAMSRNEETLKAEISYVALPDLRDKVVILSDTMLATGGSLIDAIKIIEEKKPKKIIVIAAIASKPGIERIINYNPKIEIFVAATDPMLNEKGYIIPGLGDAGDRAYGKKSH